MGLFLGMSMITVTEFFSLMLMILFYIGAKYYLDKHATKRAQIARQKEVAKRRADGLQLPPRMHNFRKPNRRENKKRKRKGPQKRRMRRTTMRNPNRHRLLAQRRPQNKSPFSIRMLPFLRRVQHRETFPPFLDMHTTQIFSSFGRRVCFDFTDWSSLDRHLF